jgi:hypothetical protein
LSLITLPIFGCEGKSSTNPLTPGDVKALNAAQAWLISQGRELNTTELKVHREGDNWSVFIWYLPRTPGGYVVLEIDADGKVIDVSPGL